MFDYANGPPTHQIQDYFSLTLMIAATIILATADVFVTWENCAA
jgi:hypothetical protein